VQSQKNGAYQAAIQQIIEEEDRHIRSAIPLVQVSMQEALKTDSSSRVKAQPEEGR
jgi:hypothetical protein